MMWTDSTSSSPRTCRNCDSHVSQSFRRTVGDTEGVVHRCLACDTRARIQLGSAAGRDVDWPDPADQPNRNRGTHTDQLEKTKGSGAL